MYSVLLCPKKPARILVGATEFIPISFFFPRSSCIQYKRLCRNHLLEKEMRDVVYKRSFKTWQNFTIKCLHWWIFVWFVCFFLFLPETIISLTQTISLRTGHVCKSSQVLATYLVWWQERGWGSSSAEEWEFLKNSLLHCSPQGTNSSSQWETFLLIFIPLCQHQEIILSQLWLANCMWHTYMYSGSL